MNDLQNASLQTKQTQTTHFYNGLTVPTSAWQRTDMRLNSNSTGVSSAHKYSAAHRQHKHCDDRRQSSSGQRSIAVVEAVAERETGNQDALRRSVTVVLNTPCFTRPTLAYHRDHDQSGSTNNYMHRKLNSYTY